MSNPNKDTVITVAYWNIRGAGAPLRMMVMYSGATLRAVSYDDVPVADGTFDDSAWFDKKPQFVELNALINLPYIQDGSRTISQSIACALHLGRRLGLQGKSEDSQIWVEQLLCEVVDLRSRMTRFAYSDTASAETAEKLVGEVSGIVKKFELHLSRQVARGFSGTFLVDDYATTPDFGLWELADQFQGLTSFYGLKPFFADYPNLARWYEAFRALPENQKYLNSALAALPYNGKEAGFGASFDRKKWVFGVTPAVPNTSGDY